MLKLTWIDFFLRLIPESFIIIYGVQVISKKYFDITTYIISSILISISVFFIRWLPIYFGVHMIINLFVLINVMVIIGVPLIKAIYSNLLMYFLLSLSEFLNMIILNSLNISTSSKMISPLMKCIFGLPSLIMFPLFVMIIKYSLKGKEGIKSVSN